MRDKDSVTLVRLVRQGDEQAATELFERYVTRLVALARSHLSPLLKRRVDPEDVVQSAYRSFFRHTQNGRYELRRSGDLWRLLAAITVNKVRRKTRQHNAAKRSVNSETQFDGAGALMGLPPEKIDDEPTPAEICALIEELELVLKQLSPLYRQILEYRGQGKSISDTASELECTERTIYRVQERYESLLKTRLEAITRD